MERIRFVSENKWQFDETVLKNGLENKIYHLSDVQYVSNARV